MTTIINVYDLDPDALEREMVALGEPAYRGRQLFQALYTGLVENAGQVHALPQDLRSRLAERVVFGTMQAEIKLDSSDGQTTKTLFRLDSGEAIEAVLMRYRKRRTLCISTQAGCAMGCVFCATGQMGFRQNLTSGQIVEQVVYYTRLLQLEDDRPTNIVLMGMGEPFHNYEATMAAIDRLNHPNGMNLGARRFTLSTVGLVPAIRRFAKEKRQVNLAVSLHAIDDELRTSMLPINRRYPVETLLEACRDYVAETGRRITFEWALIKGVNDTREHAEQLGDRLAGINCHVNVIPLNPTDGYSGKATSKMQALAFQQALDKRGIPCTVRIRRGIDIRAGCGQLVVAQEPKTEQSEVGHA